MINFKIDKPETLALVKFALIGAIGFSIDAGILYLGVYIFSTPLSSAMTMLINYTMVRLFIYVPK